MKEIILIFLFIVFIIILGYLTYLLYQDNDIVVVKIPQEIIFRMALVYHKVDIAHIKRDINCFYFMKDGKRFPLFSPDFERWVLTQPLIDSYYK